MFCPFVGDIYDLRIVIDYKYDIEYVQRGEYPRQGYIGLGTYSIAYLQFYKLTLCQFIEL